jgi:hypothetical protein
LKASFSGLCVVCGSCLVASSGFMERKPICPKNAADRWKKRAIVPHRHYPVLLLWPGRPAVEIQRANFAGGCMSFPGDCIAHARNGRGIKKNGVQTAREATSGLAGCIYVF